MKEKERQKDTRMQILEKTLEGLIDDLKKEKEDCNKEKNTCPAHVGERESYLVKGSEESERNCEMCPLRIILIFLSATLAGFFVLKNLKSPPIDPENDDVKSPTDKEIESPNSLTLSNKVCGAIRKGFWTFVDMASGRYLWRNLVSSSTSCTGKRAD
ncbi:Uncharacterized protein Fot_41841 [Forsythia ovata]|uniref:Uncharacterized protein n=1 Tax=Forsythia ovata TaxID=205694 RepID=A0ABD1RKI0_9LAMI